MNLSARIRELIAARGAPTACADLCAELSLSPVPVSQALAVMWRAGLLVRHGDRRPYGYTLGREAKERGTRGSPEAQLAARRAKHAAKRLAEGPRPRKQRAPAPARPTPARPVAPRAVPLRPLPPPKPAQPPLPSVAAWLEAGGQIEQLPRGACSQPLRFDHGDRR